MKSAKQNKTVKVRILDKEVQIGCAAGEEDDLSRAAHHVDTAMRELRGRNITSTTEKVAILTAINVANELLKSQVEEESHEQVQQKIDEMQSQLDEALRET